MSRTATVERNTRETRISISLDLDGSGHANLDTGIGFFNHMLDGFARHGLFDRESYLAQLSGKQSETRKGFAVMEAVSCLWMRHWYFVP